MRRVTHHVLLVATVVMNASYSALAAADAVSSAAGLTL
jgi:hypothetical protein